MPLYAGKLAWLDTYASKMRYLFLYTTAVLLTALMHASWGAPGLSYPRKPKSHSKPKPHQCVQKFDANDGALVFLLNQCEELMYVSVLEYIYEMPPQICAVFGLQGGRLRQSLRPT
jgi:hypothetical protein